MVLVYKIILLVKYNPIFMNTFREWKVSHEKFGGFANFIIVNFSSGYSSLRMYKNEKTVQ